MQKSEAKNPSEIFLPQVGPIVVKLLLPQSVSFLTKSEVFLENLVNYRKYEENVQIQFCSFESFQKDLTLTIFCEMKSSKV